MAAPRCRSVLLPGFAGGQPQRHPQSILGKVENLVAPSDGVGVTDTEVPDGGAALLDDVPAPPFFELCTSSAQFRDEFV